MEEHSCSTAETLVRSLPPAPMAQWRNGYAIGRGTVLQSWFDSRLGLQNLRSLAAEMQTCGPHLTPLRGRRRTNGNAVRWRLDASGILLPMVNKQLRGQGCLGGLHDRE